MLALMDELDHPHVRLNFDTGNIAYYNRGVDPADELEKVKHLVRNVHLKDNRGGFEDWYFPAVGDGGSVDFTRVRQILDGVGFAGPYTIEIEGIGGEPEPGLEGRQDRIAELAHLRPAATSIESLSGSHVHAFLGRQGRALLSEILPQEWDCALPRPTSFPGSRTRTS